MLSLSPQLLGKACRIFMSLAYPDGPETIPARKRPYFAVNEHHLLADYLPPSERASGIARELRNAKGETHGFEFRLGSSHFPHLKLRVQEMANHQGPTWVFMVDTHDHFPRVDHGADETAWQELQARNRQVKEEIEAALEEEGLMTPNKLLRLDLAT